MKKKFDFSGKNIVITGGSGFLGSKIAKEFLSYNANVFIIDKKINFKFSKKKFVKTDLSKKANIDTCFEFFKKKKINIFSLINCLSYQTNQQKEYVGDIKNQSYEAFDKSLDINLTSYFYLMKKFSTLMKKKNSNIINISSIYSLIVPDRYLYKNTGMGNSASYSASKAGLNQLTNWFASYLSPKIRVNCISLGGVYNNQNSLFVKKYSKKVLLKRMARPNEIVGPVLFLASDLSSYISGHNLVVDGGYTKI